MNKKLIVFSILMFLTLSIFTLSYGTDIVMDLDNSSNSNSATQNTTSSQNALTNTVNTTNTAANTSSVDNTIYSSQNTVTEQPIQEPTITTTSSYDESSDLSITNIIDISPSPPNISEIMASFAITSSENL